MVSSGRTRTTSEWHLSIIMQHALLHDHKDLNGRVKIGHERPGSKQVWADLTARNRGLLPVREARANRTATTPTEEGPVPTRDGGKESVAIHNCNCM